MWLTDVHQRVNRRTGQPLAANTLAKASKVLNTVIGGAAERGYVAVADAQPAETPPRRARKGRSL